MKNRVFYALLGIALAAPVAAFAGEPNTNSQSGHYEWRQSPNYGPRAPSMSPRRVWVPDAPQMANCNCDMMKMSAADCMMNMPGKPKAPSAG